MSCIQSLEKQIITLEEQIEKHKQEIINIKSKKTNRGIAIYNKLTPDIQDIIDKYVYMNNCDNKLDLLNEYNYFRNSYYFSPYEYEYPYNEFDREVVKNGSKNKKAWKLWINEVWLDFDYPRTYLKNKFLLGIDKCKTKNDLKQFLNHYGFRISNFNGRKKQEVFNDAREHIDFKYINKRWKFTQRIVFGCKK